jgi:DinB superfamily
MSAPTTIDSATATLLREAFEGPAGPSTYFIDNDKKAGFFAVLDALSAAEASRPMRPGGPTVAGHAHHAGFHLDMSSAWLRGDREPRDWDVSWQVKTVDEPAWAALRRRLRQQYASLRDAIEKEPSANGVELATTIGAIAHAAYHLGAVRQSISARSV